MKAYISEELWSRSTTDLIMTRDLSGTPIQMLRASTVAFLTPFDGSELMYWEGASKSWKSQYQPVGVVYQDEVKVLHHLTLAESDR